MDSFPSSGPKMPVLKAKTQFVTKPYIFRFMPNHLFRQHRSDCIHTSFPGQPSCTNLGNSCVEDDSNTNKQIDRQPFGFGGKLCLVWCTFCRINSWLHALPNLGLFAGRKAGFSKSLFSGWWSALFGRIYFIRLKAECLACAVLPIVNYSSHIHTQNVFVVFGMWHVIHAWNFKQKFGCTFSTHHKTLQWP